MIPRFYVVARINGADGALNKWVERFTGLCKATATEPMSLTYYWGTDQDGETDVLWGLEGYSHPVGFFVGHGQSAEFKHEMSLIDEDNLLRNIQGFPSPDYDLHYYDFEGGWLTREDDPLRDSKESFVAVVHFWAKEGKRKEVMKKLGDFATCASSLQSCAVLKECMDANLTTLWLRSKSSQEYENFISSSEYMALMESIDSLLIKTEVHRSQSFNGHIDRTPLREPSE